MRVEYRLPIEIMARQNPWYEGVSIRMRQCTVGDGEMHAQPITWEKADPGLVSEPMMELGMEEAQQLMDELWKCGLRPTEGAGSAGAMAATQKHLEDMRTLAFRALNETRKD